MMSRATPQRSGTIPSTSSTPQHLRGSSSSSSSNNNGKVPHLLSTDDIKEILVANKVERASKDVGQAIQTAIDIAAHKIILDICAYKKQTLAQNTKLSVSAEDVYQAMAGLKNGPLNGRNFYDFISTCDAFQCEPSPSVLPPSYAVSAPGIVLDKRKEEFSQRKKASKKRRTDAELVQGSSGLSPTPTSLSAASTSSSSSVATSKTTSTVASIPPPPTVNKPPQPVRVHADTVEPNLDGRPILPIKRDVKKEDLQLPRRYTRNALLANGSRMNPNFLAS